jgi:hypothetical protein
MNDDFDHDGFSNWDEYALKSHPLDPDSLPRLVYRVVEVDGQRFPILASDARGDSDDIQFLIEGSVDLDVLCALAAFPGHVAKG